MLKAVARLSKHITLTAAVTLCYFASLMVQAIGSDSQAVRMKYLTLHC